MARIIALVEHEVAALDANQAGSNIARDVALILARVCDEIPLVKVGKHRSIQKRTDRVRLAEAEGNTRTTPQAIVRAARGFSVVHIRRPLSVDLDMM